MLRVALLLARRTDTQKPNATHENTLTDDIKELAESKKPMLTIIKMRNGRNYAVSEA